MASNSALDQANALSADMLDQTRLALMTTYRFMDVALWRMPSKRRNLTCALASDGT